MAEGIYDASDPVGKAMLGFIIEKGSKKGTHLFPIDPVFYSRK
jgi:hypothetical protein